MKVKFIATGAAEAARFSFEIASNLTTSKEKVLAHATHMGGVNQELRPLLSMTSPRSFRDRSLFEAPVGQPLFRSWVLLGGILPIDFDHLCFASIEPDSGFVETSTMLSMSSWRHERRVTPRDGGGSRIVDRISFTPRVPGTGPLLARVTAALFRHRHTKLRSLFGSRTSAPTGERS